MSIKQFNGEWVAQEDRILFRFNTSEGQEFRLWLTRHMVKNLIQGSQTLTVQALQKAHPPQVAQAMQDFQQQSVTQQLNFETAFEQQDECPLGEVPALVTGLRITLQSPQVVVDFETQLGRTVHLTINESLLRAMIGLLDKLQALAQWQLTLSGSPSPAASGSSALVH